jgi:hypothetical protein
MTLEALIRTARRRRFAAMQMGDELLAADWGMMLERLERLAGPPDGYALVTPAGAFVGIWRARARRSCGWLTAWASGSRRAVSRRGCSA